MTGRFSTRHGITTPVWGLEKQVGVDYPAVPEGSPKELDYAPFGPAKPGGGIPGVDMRDPKPGQAPKGPSLDEVMLPAVLKQLPTPYATAGFGKWHMAGPDNGFLDHPNLIGLDHYSGPLSGALDSFFAWQHMENGVARQETGYVDQKAVDDASAWISKQPADQPWFVWFSFINPHEPFHKPPAELIQSEELKALDPQGITPDNMHIYFKAQVEAMDTHVGQLLQSIPADQRDNTYVFWLGDNGDDVWAKDPAVRKPNRYKLTVYEGGIRVPFVVTGPGIAGGSHNAALTNIVDLFDTIIELAGSDSLALRESREIDSVSFAGQLLGEANAPQRAWNFSEANIFKMGRDAAIRNAEYKLIAGRQGEMLFNLINDPDERNNLLESDDPVVQSNYAQLKQQLDSILPKNEPPPRKVPGMPE